MRADDASLRELFGFVVMVGGVTRDLEAWNGECLVGYLQAANKKDSLGRDYCSLQRLTAPCQPTGGSMLGV
jgi:hypothetical protein